MRSKLRWFIHNRVDRATWSPIFSVIYSLMNESSVAGNRESALDPVPKGHITGEGFLLRYETTRRPNEQLRCEGPAAMNGAGENTMYVEQSLIDGTGEHQKVKKELHAYSPTQRRRKYRKRRNRA